MQQDLIASYIFIEKYSYAHYLSYATLLDYVIYVGAILYQLPCTDIFCKFWAKEAQKGKIASACLPNMPNFAKNIPAK